jgi:hypothetical protein
MNLLIYSSKDSPRLRYVINVLFTQIMGLKSILTNDASEFMNFDGPKVNYSDKSFPDGSPWISPHPLIFGNNVAEQDITVAEWEGHKIFFQTSPGCALPFDIFAASFYLLSRYEEYLPFKEDRYGRFEADQSLAYRNGFLSEPVINQWAAKFAGILTEKYRGFSVGKKKFRYLSTIDVDNAWAYLHKGLFRTAGAFIKSLLRFDLQDLSDRLRTLIEAGEDPYFVFDYLKEQESKYGFDTVYFFLYARYGRYDRNIPLRKEAFRKLILDKYRSSRVGIHPSYRSGSDSSVLNLEITTFSSLLGTPVKKSRQHFLVIRFPETFRRLINEGIKEDYSLGYSSVPGFRAGICTPFRFYDLLEEKETELTLVPFTVMDVTLNEYMKLSPDKAIDKIRELVSKVKNVNGTFVSLWHNESLSETRHWKGWRRVYEKMLKIIYPHLP